MQDVLAEGATKYPHSQHLVIVAAHDERLAPSCVRDRQQTKAQTTSMAAYSAEGSSGKPSPPARRASPQQHTERLTGVGIGDSHLHAHAGGDADRGDVLHQLRGAVQVDDALVDAHLEAVPSVGTLTARALAGGDTQGLGRQAHGARHGDALLDGLRLQLLAHCGNKIGLAAPHNHAPARHPQLTGLQALDITGSQGHADLVQGRLDALLLLVERHSVEGRGLTMAGGV